MRPAVTIIIICLFVSGGIAAGPESFRIPCYLQSVTDKSAIISFEWNKPTPCKLVYGMTREYEYSNNCSGDKINNLLLDSLEEGTKYYYNIKVRNKLQFADQSEYYFYTSSNNKQESLVFAVIGDTRNGDESFNSTHLSTIESIKKSLPQFLLHAGDLVDVTAARAWENFFEIESSLLRNTPIYPNRGSSDGSLEDFNRIFTFPGTKGWNTFQSGPVFVIGLDIQFNKPGGYYKKKIGPKSKQYRWLEKVLQSSVRKEHPFTIVSLISPLFTPDNLPHPYLVQTLVPLLEKYHVDLVISASVHYFSYAQKNNVHYIISGGGGAALENPERINREEVINYHPAFHHLRVSVHYPAMSIEALDNNGSAFFARDIIHQNSEGPGPGSISQQTLNTSGDIFIFGSGVCADCQELKQDVLPNIMQRFKLENVNVVFSDIEEEKNYLQYLKLENELSYKKHSFPVLVFEKKFYSGDDLKAERLAEVFSKAVLQQPDKTTDPVKNRLMVLTALFVTGLLLWGLISFRKKKHRS